VAPGGSGLHPRVTSGQAHVACPRLCTGTPPPVLGGSSGFQGRCELSMFPLLLFKVSLKLFLAMMSSDEIENIYKI